MGTTNRKTALAAAVMAVAAGLIGARAVHAASFVWDGSDAATNTNLSNGLNWVGDPAAGPTSTADTVTFDDTGIASPISTVDTNMSIGKLIYQQNGSSADGTVNAYTTVIGAGMTFSPFIAATSNLTIPANASLLVMPSNAAPTAVGGGTTGAYVKITSGAGGELRLVNAGSLSLSVSGRPMPSGTPGPNESFAVLDLSGLDKFTFSTAPSFTFSSFGVGAGLETTGDQGAVSGKLILGNLSNIDANRISIGGQSNSGSQGSQPVSLLLLGQTTNINVNLSGNLDVGGNPDAMKDSSGGMLVRSGLTDAVLTLGSAANRPGLGVARHRGSTGHNAFGVVDTTSASGAGEGTFNAFTSGTQRIGTGATGGAGAGIGMLSMDKGTLDTTGSVLVGATGTTQNAGPNTGYINVGLKGTAADAGAGAVVTPGNITLGQRFHAGVTNTNSGILNLANDGAVTADRVFLGDNLVADAGSGATAGATVGEVNLNGGILTTGQVKAGSATAQVGTVNTRLVHFNGGTLKAKSATTFAANFMEGLTHATVGAAGGTIDTNGVDVTVNQALEAPAANGITAIDVAAGGSGYRVAPVVLITRGAGDTTGTGASAVAQISSAGVVTGITVTNPGSGYSAPPVVQLIANGGTTIANMATPFGGTSATLNVTIGTPASGGINKAGDGKLTLTGANTYTGVTGVDAGVLQLGLAAHAAVLTGGGADVRGGSLVLDYTGGTSPADTVRAGLQSGLIHSSTGTTARGLGWADDTTASQVSVVPALYGDSNLDRTVDLTDFTFLAANFNKNGGATWLQGDYNYDGNVDLTDFTFLASNFNQSLSSDGGGLGSAVPEPASVLTLCALACGATLRRRRRA